MRNDYLPCQHRDRNDVQCGGSPTDDAAHRSHRYVAPKWSVFGCACCGTRIKTRGGIDSRINSQGACKSCGSSVWLDDEVDDDGLADFKLRHEAAMRHYAALPPDEQR